MQYRRIVLRVVLASCSAVFLTACPGGEEPKVRCMTVTEVQTSEVSPAGVQTVFQVLDCDGEPVSDLKNKELEVQLDGEPIQTEGDTTRVLNKEVDFKQYALLLLDMSDSIIENDALGPMVDAAKNLGEKLLNEGSVVAVYRFAGPQYFGPVQAFTTDEDALLESIEGLRDSDGFGTTDLYGAMIEGLAILEGEGAPEVLSARNLVVFTDGTDEARESTFDAALAASKRTEANIYTVGLGGDVDKDELKALGKSGFEWAEDASKLEGAFEKVTQQLTRLSGSFYLVGVCSPRTKGRRAMSLIVTRGNETGKATVSYNADGFDIVGCDARRVAYPCEDLECGQVGGFFCGGCDAGKFCDEDFTCQDACEAAECGEAHGTDCGDCSDYGEGFGCDDENRCREACDGRVCGEHLGVDCGSCDDGLACTGAGQCQPRTLDGVEWARIPGGEVVLGCDLGVDEDCGFDESSRAVTLSDFWMMTTEVTVEMVQSCVDEGACELAHLESGGTCTYDMYGENLPINCIAWEGLRGFCEFIGGRLPTEAELERALRGDHDGVNDSYWVYPWGNGAPSCDRVVMNDGGPGCGTDRPSSVGSLGASAYGLFDISGNVAEWTADYYGERFASCDPEPCADPTGPSDGDERVVRGGAFDDMFDTAFRSARRTKAAPETTSPAIGGRCVTSIDFGGEK